jgi:hypothetical protein
MIQLRFRVFDQISIIAEKPVYTILVLDIVVIA